MCVCGGGSQATSWCWFEMGWQSTVKVDKRWQGLRDLRQRQLLSTLPGTTEIWGPSPARGNGGAGRPLALSRAPRGWRVKLSQWQVLSIPLLLFSPAPLLLSSGFQLLPHRFPPSPLLPRSPPPGSLRRAGSGASWSAGVGAGAQLRRARWVGGASSGCWSSRSAAGPTGVGDCNESLSP